MPLPPDTESDGGMTPAVASYPPKAAIVGEIKYIRDITFGEDREVWQSRDIGRSALFGGKCYYIFGDTFWTDRNNKFVKMVSSTIADVLDPADPFTTAYTTIDSEDNVEDFIKLTEEEKTLNNEQGIRTTLWCFGGIVETSPGFGWVWFEKGEENSESKECVPCGAGIAEVVIDKDTGLLRTIRAKELIFTGAEPRFGGFSTILEGDFIYLFAFYDSEIVLARVSRHRPSSRDAYEFWNGSEYVKELDTKGVLFNVQHGAIIKSTLFGPERPWVFVGCSRDIDSKVMVGASAQIEGPWELTAVCDAVGIDHCEGNMYCMYPHQWASDEANGELLVTWSEHWPGGVVAAKLRFEGGA